MQSQSNSLWIREFHIALRDCYECFSSNFIETTLLARLYLGLRNKPADPEVLVEAVVKMVTRDGSSALINAYSSKISVELSKSSKSYERETAIHFFYYGKCDSIQLLTTVLSTFSRSIGWDRSTWLSILIRTSK